MVDIPAGSRVSIRPAATYKCSKDRKCTLINTRDTLATILNNQGKCSALLTREGFFDFVVFRTQCNGSHNVMVVCQHDEDVQMFFNNNMSDIKVSTVSGFYTLEMFSSCAPGWFMVDNVCINFYHCPNCTNNRAPKEICEFYGGQLAYQVINYVNISASRVEKQYSWRNKLHVNKELLLFWGMFYIEDSRSFPELHQKRLFRYFVEKQFAVNGSNLCLASSMGHEYLAKFHNEINATLHCIDAVALSIKYNVTIFRPYTYIHKNLDYNIAWGSIIGQPYFKLVSYKDFALCEKSKSGNIVLTNCSDLYISCEDGTCIHNSLVCDGQPHCLHGEDEADCQQICSNHKHNCMSDCHHRDLCSCSLEYFQCLSGGCVPLQKLCDKIMHCADASDEPSTCVYMRPEQLARPSLSLDINSYINTLIQQSIDVQRRCLQHDDGSSFPVHHVDYKMHSGKKCSPSSLSPDIKFPCTAILPYHLPPNVSLNYFALDRLCIYDHDCDDNYLYHCFNGFHLLNCEHMYCVGRFKCPSSYCMSFDHICNKACDCPHCEDENICNKLLCPGMVLIEQIGSGLRCSMQVAALKHSMNFRQVILRNGINITDDFSCLYTFRTHS